MILFYHKPRLFSRALRILFYLYFYGVRRVFAALFVTKKRDKKKSFFMILRGSSWKLSNAKRCLATPTAFASRIGQFPPVSATPTHMLRICVNSPLSRRRQPRSLARIGQFPLSRRRRPRSLRESVNSPCLGDADQRTACVGQFPQYTFGISPTITVSARATFAFISILKFDINVSTQTSAFISA